MFKVIVAGGRDFSDFPLMCEYLDRMLVNIREQIQVVSGGAKGADKLGEKYAKLKGYDLVIFPANWDKEGKSAGYIRNLQMAEYADALVAFWDGKSKGTANMINLAKQKNLRTKVKMY